MIRPARPDRDPASEPLRKPKAVGQPKAGSTAEGAPGPDLVSPDAVLPAGPKKTMPWTPAPHAGAFGHPLSRSRR